VGGNYSPGVACIKGARGQFHGEGRSTEKQAGGNDMDGRMYPWSLYGGANRRGHRKPGGVDRPLTWALVTVPSPLNPRELRGNPPPEGGGAARPYPKPTAGYTKALRILSSKFVRVGVGEIYTSVQRYPTPPPRPYLGPGGPWPRRGRSRRRGGRSWPSRRPRRGSRPCRSGGQSPPRGPGEEEGAAEGGGDGRCIPGN